MFHKEGYQIIIITVLLCIGFTLLADKFVGNRAVFYAIVGVLVIVLILVLQFFRNPKRQAPEDAAVLVAPVDGKVVVIEEVEETEFFKDKRKQVSIFMSPLNVHVTRYPGAGEVTFSKYHKGKYLVAWHPKASEENERTTVVVKTAQFGEILYRQIAGALAKRIVNYAQQGDQVTQGADSGFIKFGSRVDVFLPLDATINVSINQKVRGAETVIASMS